MQKITTLAILLCVLTTSAQTNYETAMNKAFSLWEANKTTEAAQLFERIAAKEKENWLPPYYAATIYIMESFQIKDEVKLTAKLTKAQEFLDTAMLLSPDNAELLITQALLHISYIVFDGQKYGMTLSMKNATLYEKALKLAPNNPRVVLSKAESDIGAARFFGQSTAAYCKEVERAIELGKEEKITEKYYPKFRTQRAVQVLEKCKKQ